MARRWTEQEDQILHDKVGILSYPELSDLLKRSEMSLRLRRCRRKMPRFYDNFYSYSLLAAELGRSRASIRKYFSRGWLKGRKASWSSAWGKRPMIFLEKDIVSFLRRFYHLFDWHSIPNIYFRNIVHSCQQSSVAS
jgi:hypothetical protein